MSINYGDKTQRADHFENQVQVHTNNKRFKKVLRTAIYAHKLYKTVYVNMYVYMVPLITCLIELVLVIFVIQAGV